MKRMLVLCCFWGLGILYGHDDQRFAIVPPVGALVQYHERVGEFLRPNIDNIVIFNIHIDRPLEEDRENYQMAVKILKEGLRTNAHGLRRQYEETMPGMVDVIMQMVDGYEHVIKVEYDEMSIKSDPKLHRLNQLLELATAYHQGLVSLVQYRVVLGR